MININYKISTSGIYKITSPSNKVYIGQSIHVYQRWAQYKSINKKSMGVKIFNSLKKYGPENHLFELIEECNITQLNERELFWKQHYLMLNDYDYKKVLFCELWDNGTGPRSKETKDRISKTRINKNIKFSEEHKKKLSEARKQYWKNKFSLI